DANRNFVPDCDLLNPVANGECGAMSDPAFGTTRRTLTIDPDLVRGWGKRDTTNWQFSAGVQREILPNVSLDVSYFRTWFVNFTGIYTVPRVRLQVSGSFQSIPGPEITASYVASLAEIVPSLGRNLAGGARNFTVPLVSPGTIYGDRLNQIDVRFSRPIKFD